MMRNIKSRLVLVLAFLICGLSSIAFANSDWTYAGRFVLRDRAPIAHNVDVFLINHLSVWDNQSIGTGSQNYLPYDVYYMHDHSSDIGDSSLTWANQCFRFQVKIVPLNIKFETMGSGYYAGAIVCDYIVAAKGVYGVMPKEFRVFDIISHEEVFRATGNMGSEQLYQDSAAEAILKKSGDHPVDGGKISEFHGVGYYPYR